MKKTRHIPFLIILCSLLFLVGNPLEAQKKKKKKKQQPEALTSYERANAEYLLIDAEKYFLLEDYQRALAFLKQSLEIDPQNHAAHFKAAEIHYLTNNLDEASSCIEKALALHKKNKYYYILAAKINQGKNNLPLAVLQYEEMIKNTTGHDNYLYDLMDMYEALNQYDKAISTLDLILEKFGDDEALFAKKVNLLVNAGRQAEALLLSKTLTEENPDNADYLVNHVALLSTYESKESAILFLEKNQETSQARWILTQLYLETGQEARANTLLIATFEDPSVTSDNKILLMNDLLTNGIGEKNIELLLTLQQTLEKFRPGDKNVLKSAALIYGKLADFDTSGAKTSYQNKAISSLLKIKEEDPSDFDTWNQILNTLYDLSSWEALLKNSEEALDLFPNQALFYFFHGVAFLQMGQYEDATDALLQGERLAFNNRSLKARVNNKLGEVYDRKKEYQKAEESFEKALKLDTQSPEILNNYSLHLALRQHRMEEALEMSNQLIRLAKGRLDFMHTRAYVLFRAERYAEARKALEEGLSYENVKPSGKVLEHYGDILAKLGLIEEALEQWLKAKELGNTSDKINQKIENKAYYE